MVDTFAEYILNEKDYVKKIEILYYFQKKTGIFFDNTVILKTEIAKMFMDAIDLNVDKNIAITACLLCGCKKKKDATDIKTVKSYAKDGANYLSTLGFDKRFCKICEEVNRYSGSKPREPESDILELVDSFGGLVLDRPERKGYPINEALVLTEDRNLKGLNNRFIKEFKEFIAMEEGNMSDNELKTIDDFNGKIADAIKIANECNYLGIKIKDNILIDSGIVILKKLKLLHGKDENRIREEQEEEMKKRASLFGIGQN